MHWLRVSPFVGLLGVLAVGCRPQLPPEEDAILYYVLNARVQGEVRRAWPEGQRYVDDVLHADAALQKELNKLARQNLESLWSPDDPRWQEASQVAAQTKTLSDLLDAGRATRAELLEKLRLAVEKTPGSPKVLSGNPREFVDKVWRALALDGPGLGMDVREAGPKLEEFAQARLQLYKAVQDAASELDPKGAGLKFKNPPREQEIKQLYWALAERLRQRREDFLKYSEQTLLARPSASDNAQQKRYDGFRRTYLKKQLEALPKGILNMIEKTEGELKPLEKELKKLPESDANKRATLETEIASHKQRIEDLTKEREELKTRVDAILKKAQETAK